MTRGGMDTMHPPLSAAKDEFHIANIWKAGL